MLLTVILAVGGAIGSIHVRSFSLGPAAVLFTTLAFSAHDDRLRLPQILGAFGLAMVAYVIAVEQVRRSSPRCAPGDEHSAW